AVRRIFFFNDTATTEIYTLSLHDALPICSKAKPAVGDLAFAVRGWPHVFHRSEEHTSELQSHSDLVCRLLLDKKTSMISSFSLHFFFHALLLILLLPCID